MRSSISWSFLSHLSWKIEDILQMKKQIGWNVVRGIMEYKIDSLEEEMYILPERDFKQLM